jgi:glycosyltransferase involved in cell wall biosynthesis
MRIGFIEDTHLHGGTQIWVSEAVRACIARGQDVTLLAPTDSWVVKQCEDTSAQIFTYDWDEVVHEDVANQKIWTQALKDCDVAICTVHPPREGFHCSVFAGRCIKEGNLKTHLIPKTGTIVPEYLREFYLPEESIRSTVIAIADFTRQYLIQAYHIPEEKAALVYQGTDVERFCPTEEGKRESLKRYPLPEDAGPVLGSIGSFEHRKGHPTLFEAVVELKNTTLPNIHVMLVGDGPDEDMLKSLVSELGIEDNVSFFPFTSEPNIVYERLDITVLPSLYKEGLPNVLLESMAMGVPIVSSNLGGVPEVVRDGKTGYMVEPGDSKQLASAIHKLWSNQDDFQQIRKNVRQFITERFNKETQFDAFIAYFYKVISEKGTAS